MLMVVSTLTCKSSSACHGCFFPMLTSFVRSNPCHIELILTEGEEVVQKSQEVAGRDEGKHLNSRQRAQRIRKAITGGS